MSSAKVVLVEDSEYTELGFQQTLQQSGYDVDIFHSGQTALPSITQIQPDIVISDVIMPDMDGLDLMKRVFELDPELPVILITGEGDIPTAVRAIQEGAYDFLEKPFSAELLLEVVRRALEKRELIQEVKKLRHQIQEQQDSNFHLIGKSPVISRLRQMIAGMSGSDPDVLIMGETGTGKDLMARCLHENSPREGKNFVAINCGALPETIIESELFGHEAGSFTGADHRRIGKFEYADGGTVFLDEIESMPLHLQVKLLHVLQDRVIYRIGSNEPIPVNVRMIAATKEDLKQSSDEGKFRMDLYYRLNVFEVFLPPLRERMEDVPLLFNHFVTQIGWRYKVSVLSMPPRKEIQKLLSRNWEGNVRELKNEAEKYVLQLVTDIDRNPQFPESLCEPPVSGKTSMTLNEQLTIFEKTIIEQELTRQKGDIKNTYLALGIPRQTLYYKIQKYGLNRKNYQTPQFN